MYDFPSRYELRCYVEPMLMLTDVMKLTYGKVHMAPACPIRKATINHNARKDVKLPA